MVITARSEAEANDKRLKTISSERVVPVHCMLIELGFLRFVEARRRTHEVKLFPEVAMAATGYRSATFSAWFNASPKRLERARLRPVSTASGTTSETRMSIMDRHRL